MSILSLPTSMQIRMVDEAWGLEELKQGLQLIRYSKAGTVKKERYDQDLSLATTIIERLLDEAYNR